MRHAFAVISSLFCLISSAPGAESIQKFANLGDFRTEKGGIIPNCQIGYRTFGTLNADRSNAILFPTWFSGQSQDLEGSIGPGKPVNSDRFYVIAVDALGNGLSSSPSNIKGGFPEITIRDMVNSQHLLLTKHLGISHLRAVIGISMGGMQTFEWITAYPEFMDRAVPIIGSPKLTSTDLLLWHAELNAIESAAKCKCDARSAMETVNAIHQFALYTPEYRAAQTTPEQFGEFKATLAAGKMAPADWAAQLKAMMSHDVGRGSGGSVDAAARKVRARTLVVIARQDHMVNPIPAMRFADRINAKVLELTGNCGHMATSCEVDIMTPVVQEFLGTN